MHLQPLIGDLTWQSLAEAPANAFTPCHSTTFGSDPAIEAVVGGAVMVACAFRLRDEAGLVAALRVLTEAVAGMERAADA